MHYGGNRSRPAFGQSDRPGFGSNSSDRPAFGQKTSFNQKPDPGQTRTSSYMDQMRQEEQAGRGGMGYRGYRGGSKYGNFSSGGR